MKHTLTLLTALLLAPLAALHANAAPTPPSQRFVDDFSQPSTVWRFGNAIHRADARGLALSARAPEVTLVGTAVHPENLRGFTASVRWNFGGKDQRCFVIGWGKPFEWSTSEDCAEKVAIRADGMVTVWAGAKQIGTGRVAVSDKGDASLSVSRRPDAILLSGDGKEVVVPLPAGARSAAGYFVLRVQSLDRAAPPLRVQHVEIQCEGDQPPLTEAQRSAEIQRWATQKLRGNWHTLEQFEQHLKAEAAAGRWGFENDLNVEPGLVKPGETVRVTFRCAGGLPSRCEARVEPDFLRGQGGLPQPLALRWREVGGAREATVELTPKQCGNWRIVWQSGDDQISRVFGVVDRGYAVCRLLVTNDKALNKPKPDPAAHDLIHEFGLAADHWDGAEWISPFSRTPESLVAHFKLRAALRHRWGDRFMPMCNANWMLPGCPDTNLWRFDDDVQREGLRQIARLWDLLGLGPLDVLASYTFGHSTPRIARSVGVKMLDSLVQWQNWRDGADDNAWLINQWGAPTVPYYVADDDFRKVAPGRSIVAFTQATTSSVRIYYINTLEGQPQLASLRRRRADDMAESANIDRFETAADLLLAEAAHQSEPLFLSIGMENFVDSPDWNEANRRGVHYLREQARRKQLVFAQAAAIADFYQRHYPRQPETWLYWPDIYAGFQAGHKPRQVPDRIELSNARFHSVHEDGAALPRFLWDYTRRWNEPVWDDQAAIRQKFGLPTPDLVNATNCVPRMVDLDGVKARVEIEPEPGGARPPGAITVRMHVDSPRDLGALPVAVWRIPLRAEGCEVVETSRGARFLRVVDGSTGNLHGVLVCERVPKGSRSWTVRLRGQLQPPLEPNFRIGDDVRGRSFQRATGTTAYVWLVEASQRTGTLALRVPAGRQASVHYNDGRIEQPRDGILQVVLDRTWQHESPMISGLTAAEIQAASRFEPATAKP
jgi:hypothetical protein